jgi:ATP-binding cassette subfamily B protein
MASSCVGYIIPKNIEQFYSHLDDRDLFFYSLMSLLTIFIAQYLLRVFYRIFINIIVKRVLIDIRNEMYSHWLNLKSTGGDQSDDEFPLGEILSRLINDTEVIKELINSGAFTIVLDFFFVLSCIISFYQTDVFYGSVLFGSEIITAIVLVWLSQFIAKSFFKVRKSMGKMSRTLTDIIHGIDQLYYLPSKGYALNRSEKSFDRFLSLQLKANFWDASYFSITESLFPIFLVIVVAFLPMAGKLEVAVFAVLVDLIQRSIGPIKDIASKISALQRASSGVVRISEFNDYLKLRQDEKKRESASKLKNFNLKIESFRYQNTDSSPFELRDLRIDSELGKTIALIGESGCGKSTILKILAGQLLSENSRLQIEIQGGDLSSYTGEHVAKVLEEKSCLITQDSHIFSSTLEFNITLERESNHGFPEFWQRLIEKLPYLKTWDVKPEDILNPSELSQGQKQLISILRYYYQPKPIVLFDEISSALDSELELALATLLKELKKTSMVFIVAHRVETILDSDEILLVEKGKLIARGDHKTLLNSSQLYNNVIELFQY